jgi:hypothetical protein
MGNNYNSREREKGKARRATFATGVISGGVFMKMIAAGQHARIAADALRRAK